jgi:cell division inhibitor SulA
MSARTKAASSSNIETVLTIADAGIASPVRYRENEPARCLPLVHEPEGPSLRLDQFQQAV